MAALLHVQTPTAYNDVGDEYQNARQYEKKLIIRVVSANLAPCPIIRPKLMCTEMCSRDKRGDDCSYPLRRYIDNKFYSYQAVQDMG